MSQDTRSTVAKARDEFLAVVGGIRPELHRYCARLTGSVIEGEDIVQETLARAFYTMNLGTETPPLRPWLFKIAHNAAIDFLKSHGRTHTESRADMSEDAGFEDARDVIAIRAALTQFIALPLAQRSAVILKDVLGQSLEETADIMGTTVMAVKSALVRGRANLRENMDATVPGGAKARTDLDRYASLFNARDWDGVRSLVAEDCRLDLVSKLHRRGKEVGVYFGNYAKEDVAVRVVRLEGELALAAYPSGADRAAYFVLLEWQDGLLRAIRDYRYVPYIAVDAEYELI